MFYSGLAARTRCHSLWLAAPVATGGPGPAGPGGQGPFKGQDATTRDPGALIHKCTPSPAPLPLSLSKWHTAQILFYNAALARFYICRCSALWGRGSTFSRAPGLDVVHQFFLGRQFIYQDQIIFSSFDFVCIICTQTRRFIFLPNIIFQSLWSSLSRHIQYVRIKCCL